MLRKLALAAALLAAAPAYAADTLTITMVSDGNYVGTLSKTITFTVADMNTFQAWMLANFPCSPAGQCTQTLPLAATAWLTGFKAGTTASVMQWVNANAASSAVSVVVPIAPN
jgi:hypothetical protein